MDHMSPKAKENYSYIQNQNHHKRAQNQIYFCKALFKLSFFNTTKKKKKRKKKPPQKNPKTNPKKQPQSKPKEVYLSAVVLSF